MDMNDRFKQPKRKQKLPEGKQAKCALAYSLLVKNFEYRGVPPEIADEMATDVVTTVLEATAIAEEAARLRYSIYSTVYNN
jgi:hypothetical protein